MRNKVIRILLLLVIVLFVVVSAGAAGAPVAADSQQTAACHVDNVVLYPESPGAWVRICVKGRPVSNSIGDS
jgi:hypothetical protein